MNDALKNNGNDAKKVCENFGCVVREVRHQVRQTTAAKKGWSCEESQWYQDTMTINEALKDNGNDAKKVCENFGCVVRERQFARPKLKLRCQASIETHEENMQAIQKKLKGCFNKATIGRDLLEEARAFNEKP